MKLKALCFVGVMFLAMPFADADTVAESALRHAGGVLHERHSFVAVADRAGMILSDRCDDSRRKLGYLLIDNAGVPYFFPATRGLVLQGEENQLHFSSKTLLETLYQTAKFENSTDGIEFEGYGWNAGWKKYRVSLRFDKDKCAFYKVCGDGIEKDSWLPTDPYPRAVRKSTEADLHANLSLPIDVYCNLDGPRDVTVCGFSPEVIDERPYHSGREERHRKTSPTLPEGSPIPDNE